MAKQELKVGVVTPKPPDKSTEEIKKNLEEKKIPQKKIEELVGKEPDLGPKAGELAPNLLGDKPLEGERIIYLEVRGTEAPKITFGGLWTGRYLKAALKCIEREYRIRRHIMIGSAIQRDELKRKAEEAAKKQGSEPVKIGG